MWIYIKTTCRELCIFYFYFFYYLFLWSLIMLVKYTTIEGHFLFEYSVEKFSNQMFNKFVNVLHERKFSQTFSALKSKEVKKCVFLLSAIFAFLSFFRNRHFSMYFKTADLGYSLSDTFLLTLYVMADVVTLLKSWNLFCLKLKQSYPWDMNTLLHFWNITETYLIRLLAPSMQLMGTQIQKKCLRKIISANNLSKNTNATQTCILAQQNKQWSTSVLSDMWRHHQIYSVFRAK